MTLDALKIYESPYTKIRLGNNGDGGYIIADIEDYDLLLSCGIADDISFEVDFLKKHNIKCVAFDGTINKLPEEHPNIQFVKKNISWMEINDTTNLHSIINQHNNIFLKMDIETFEFRWLLTLNDELLTKIKQLVIEFHFPFNEPGFTTLDQPLPVNLKMDVLKKITNTHTLIHLHANNCCGTRIFNGITVPNVFECTYIRNDLVSEYKLNSQAIPHPLDKPNTNNPEIHLSGYPFTA